MRHTLQILFSFSGTMVTRCCISIIWLELVLVLIGCTTKNISAFQLSRTSTVSFPNQPLVQRTPFQSHSYGFGQHGHRHLHETRIFSSDGVSEDDKERSVSVSVDSNCWNPSIRKLFVVLSSIGMAETGYLSYLKLFDPNGINSICGGGDVSSMNSISSCSSVLNSPYGSIQVNEEVIIPLTAIGFLAYSTIAGLSALPLLSNTNENEQEAEADNDMNIDSMNRIAILCTTTSMATFSSFLISLLFNTLHQSCPYCILSATLSFTMGFTAWFSGMLPNDNKSSKEGIKYALGSFVTTVVMSLTFFFSIDQASISAYQNDILAANGLSNNIVAAATEEESKQNIPPPPITTTSSERSLKIGKDLKELNSRFFGAYWCSHCYEQKLRLGKEAMTNVQYIECSKEGLNSQAAVCNDRKVPGYPTWEIGGKLYPGEMYLDELEDIIAKAKKDI